MKLVDFTRIKDCFDKKILSPIEMHAYYFSKIYNEIQIKQIKILPIKSHLDRNLICEFITNNESVDNFTKFIFCFKFSYDN